MAKTITAVAASIQITNSYTPDALANFGQLDPDQVFNTGCASLDNAHIDEIANNGKTLVTDRNPWNAKHIAMVRFFKSNTEVLLAPGDSIKLTTASSEETAYYAQMDGKGFLTVTAIAAPEAPTSGKFITGESAPESEATTVEFLGRTTGVGDIDDGNADTEYPLQFDSKDYTDDGEINESTNESSDDEGGEG